MLRCSTLNHENGTGTDLPDRVEKRFLTPFLPGGVDESGAGSETKRGRLAVRPACAPGVDDDGPSAGEEQLSLLVHQFTESPCGRMKNT